MARDRARDIDAKASRKNSRGVVDPVAADPDVALRGLGAYLNVGDRGAVSCPFGQGQLARLAGIEPTTLGFGGQYSIH